jgi:hypothetical protein
MNNPTNKMGKIPWQHTWKQWLLLGKHCAKVLFPSVLKFKPMFNTIPNQHFNCFSVTGLDCLNLQWGWTFVYPPCSFSSSEPNLFVYLTTKIKCSGGKKDQNMAWLLNSLALYAEILTFCTWMAASYLGGGGGFAEELYFPILPPLTPTLACFSTFPKFSLGIISLFLV